MTDQPLGYFAKKAAFNASQGYRIDYKYLGMAYGIEIAVVATSLLSAWFFAELYGHGDGTTMAMMMLAPVAFAGIEIARVPLALAMRTQPNWLWKFIFALMVLCAVAVSVKSLSQLGEVMFRPRLIDVTHATTALTDARNAQQTYAGKVKAADAVVSQRVAELTDAEGRLKAVNTELGALPADRCAHVWHTNRDGRRYSTQECHADARQGVMTTNLGDAQKARADAAAKLDAARAARDTFDAGPSEARVSALELARRDAIQNSQLHSFTGMFFGKDPLEVTEAELHGFLRLFVFFPAIFASLAATALALASVMPLKKQQEAIELDTVAAATYLLDPMADQIKKDVLAATLEALAGQKAREPSVEPTMAPKNPAQPGPMRPTIVPSSAAS